jgi:hypothetical protein
MLSPFLIAILVLFLSVALGFVVRAVGRDFRNIYREMEAVDARRRARRLAVAEHRPRPRTGVHAG